MKVEADRRAADAEAADQDALDEIVRRGSREPASNVMTMAPSSPLAASRRSLLRSLESWNSVSCGRKNSRGCGVKVSAAALRPSALARLKRGADHRAVAAVHAVEIADRHHGAVQRPDIGRNIGTLRAVAGDVEVPGFAHIRRHVRILPPCRATLRLPRG